MTKLKDLKEALSSARKPDLSHVRKSLMVYSARAHEYGSAKYERANYVREASNQSADFERLRTYLGASLRHIMAALDSMELHQANDPGLQDVAGMCAAAFAADDDADTSGKVGPSGLPHLCGAVASLAMAIEQATRCGLLPADPGQPWAGVEQAHQPVTFTAADFPTTAEPAPVPPSAKLVRREAISQAHWSNKL